MAKNSNFPDNIEDYWKEREKEQRQYNIEHDAQIDEEIERIYKQMADNIQQEIDSFYAKYAKDSKISLSEAKKRVSKLDIEAYERKAEQYVKDKDFSKKANEEMKLYNATMKINRLEMLKSRIGMAIANSTDDLDKLGQDDLIDETYQEQLRMAGILGYSVRKNEKYSRIIAESSFHNATFSDRVWGNSSNLKSELERQLMTGLIQGRNHMVLSRDMAKRMNVSLYNAKRLIHTELKRCRTEAQKQSYVNGGYDQYKFLALGNACEICRELNGQIFDVKDMEPGENAPPMHPNCRCSTAPVMDEKLYNEWLDGFQEHGLSFEDWSRSHKSGALNGAWNSENDPFDKNRRKVASELYKEIMNRKKSFEIEAVAKNSGFSNSDVESIYNHVFVRKHLFSDGTIHKFDSDYYMAHSWLRIREGKNIQKHDITMLKHELAEEKIMGDSLEIEYEKVHEEVQKKYNYQKELLEYLKDHDV